MTRLSSHSLPITLMHATLTLQGMVANGITLEQYNQIMQTING